MGQSISSLEYGKACHDPIRGEFCSTMRSVANLKGLNSLLKHIDEIRFVLLSAPLDIFAINESKIDELIPVIY